MEAARRRSKEMMHAQQGDACLFDAIVREVDVGQCPNLGQLQRDAFNQLFEVE
jgi:hypothetical protein